MNPENGNKGKEEISFVSLTSSFTSSLNHENRSDVRNSHSSSSIPVVVGTDNNHSRNDKILSEPMNLAPSISVPLESSAFTSNVALPSSSSSSSSSSVSSSSAPSSSRANASLVQAPVLLSNGIEYSIHTIPKSMRQDIALVFSGIPDFLDRIDEYYTVPTSQRSIVDLTNWGGLAAIEKDLLLERFVAWSSCICNEVTKQGYWGDYIDPCSGLPVQTPYCTVVYPEVDAFETLLRYKSYNAGGCKLISHPVWKTHVYPASFFVRAPLPVLLQAIQYATDTVPMKPRTVEKEEATVSESE